MTITLDPKGSWRRQRFEFCNALEDAVAKNDPKAWAELERMGVHPPEESSNNQPRSSVVTK